MFLASSKHHRGFSLIELLVSVSIMVLITVIIVVNQRGYDNSQIIKNAADTLALDIRTAQVYGTGVKVSSAGDFQSDYGIMLENYQSSEDKGYISFADQGVKNGYYDGGEEFGTGGQCLPPECVSRVELQNGVFIKRMSLILVDGTFPDIGRTDILFRRPSLAPRIKWATYSDISAYVPQAIGVRITLQAPSGEQKNVFIYITGQISVQ